MESEQYLIEEEGARYTEALVDAVRAGSVDEVDRLIKQDGAIPGLVVLNEACGSGNLEIVSEARCPGHRARAVEDSKYLLNNFQLQPDWTTLGDAARGGHVEVVDYLVKNCGWLPCQDTLHKAAESGNMYLISEARCPGHRARAVEDSKSLLEGTYNSEDSIQADKRTLDSAVKRGNVELARYLIEEWGLQPDKITLTNAIMQNGNRELIDYLKTFS